MTEHMGYEKDRRLVMDWHNQPVKTCVGGKDYHYKSLLEYRWAQYLEFLKQAGEIDDWAYENKDCYFEFPGKTVGRVQYTADFVTYKGDSKEFYECKGYLTGPDNTKFKRVQEFYPGTTLILVMMRPDKKRVNRYQAAHKYVDRIIYASAIFKQLKGVINMHPPACDLL